MSDAGNAYDSTHIKVLEGVDAIRKRPGMWVGTTRQGGLHQLVFEAVGRAVSEVLKGGGGSVSVTLTSGGGVRIADDAPGMPVRAAGDSSETCLENVLTRPGVQGPGGREDMVVGRICQTAQLVVVNALSSRLTAEVRRDGLRWVQEYERGTAVTPPIAVGAAKGSGTTLHFRPDADIFETVDCSFGLLTKRLRELAYLNRGLNISVRDERAPDAPREERFHFPDGLGEFIGREGRHGAPLHADVIAFEREDTRMAGSMQVAFRWHDSPEERITSFVNCRSTDEGGTHVEGFRTGVTAAVNTYARRCRLLAPTEPDLGPDRTGEGLRAIVSVKLDRPQFHGATARRLDDAAVRTGVEEAVRDDLIRWLESRPDQAAAIVGKVIRDGHPPVE
ncbi:DNA gyrase subunit B [Streptomyces sp. enrichment culture]|uniref:DNA gyrase subunit B n=1 Tax=Streptomyces sp. enrichment culture TaxID=1795815 RepID=UPI003F547EB5